MSPEPSLTAAEDRDLLRHYAEEASAPAFSELVRRHLNPVFSAALRRVNGDHALAEDVTQSVFVDFARQAGRIPPDMPPGGWLHRHTGFTASKMIGRERRRRAREQESATMNTLPPTAASDPEWTATAPLLDAALDALPASDRDAIVLRFFEQKDFRSVGAALGLSDDSAQKKVSRALEKLRRTLGQRGVASSGGALASLMALHAVKGAPAALAGQISQQALAGAAAGGRTLGEALAGLNAVARLKASAAAIALAVTAGLAGPLLMRLGNGSPPAATAAARAVPPMAAASAATSAGIPAPPPPAAAPLDAEGLVAAAAAEWKGGRQSVSVMSTALGFLSQIEPSSMRQALAKASTVTDEPVRVLLYRYLLSHWAESQPQDALDWASSEVPEPQRADLCLGVMNAWAARDPIAAMGWNQKAASMSTRPVSESIIATVYRTIAQTDPAGALGRLSWLSSQNDRGQALRGILDTVQTDADRARISALVAAIPEDDLRLQARRAVVEQWARRDAPAAAAFVEKAEPAWERTRLMDSLGLTWLQNDPPRAAAWWVTHAPGPDTLVKIINVWAQQDPNAAGQWLTTQPPGPSSDTARMTFSRQVADLDPESALRWAETVSDAPLREGTIDHIFSNWRTRDAAAANAFLPKSGWPADRQVRLQSVP